MVLASEKKVLVVDDEPDIRDFLSACLEDAGFKVEIAFDGYDALEKIEKSPPDLMTLDLIMPRMSGIHLMRKLRKDERWKNIPIIIVTAHAKDEFGEKDVNELYADEVRPVPEHIIEKPITPSKLVIAISKILDVETEMTVGNERLDLMNTIKKASAEELKKIQKALNI